MAGLLPMQHQELVVVVQLLCRVIGGQQRSEGVVGRSDVDLGADEP